MGMENENNLEDTFQEMYSRYFESVKRFLMHKGMKMQDAEDLAQESFQYCYKNWDRYDSEKASRKTWLFLVVTSRWKNYIRSRKEFADIDDYANLIPDGNDMQQSVWISQVRNAIADALEKLPANQRIAIVLRHFQGKDSSQIAKVLGVSEGNVRILIYRGLRKMEKELPEEIRRTMDL